jgi:signal transduction histidine kinase
MRSFFHLSTQIPSEQAQRIHLFWIILGLVALSFTLESTLDVFILPANTLRWLLVIVVVGVSAVVLFIVSRSGYIRLAGVSLVTVLWALITVLALTDNGVRSPTVDIAYLVIILVAGLVLSERAGVFTGIVCILTLLGMAVAGIYGLLPPGQVSHGILATWEADVFYLAMVVGLQYLAIYSIKQALSQAHAELVERRRVEASLEKAIEERTQNRMHLELQRLITDHLEKERMRLARDLHDGPVQDLVALTFTLQGLIEDAENPSAVNSQEESTGDPDRRPVRETLQEIQSALQEQIHGLRGFAEEMRSPTLLRFGLERAIREHLDKFHSRYPQIDMQFEASPKDIPLPEDTRAALFRIYQEALNNVIRHAQATRVEIDLSLKDHQVRLAICDNGVGFTPPAEWLELARQGHLGLVGMRERVEAIGGMFEMNSKEGRGTTLRVTVGLNSVAR